MASVGCYTDSGPPFRRSARPNLNPNPNPNPDPRNDGPPEWRAGTVKHTATIGMLDTNRKVLFSLGPKLSKKQQKHRIPIGGGFLMSGEREVNFPQCISGQSVVTVVHSAMGISSRVVRGPRRPTLL